MCPARTSDRQAPSVSTASWLSVVTTNSGDRRVREVAEAFRPRWRVWEPDEGGGRRDTTADLKAWMGPAVSVLTAHPSSRLYPPSMATSPTSHTSQESLRRGGWA